MTSIVSTLLNWITQHATFLFVMLSCLCILNIWPARVVATGNELATHPHEHATCNKVLCAPVVSYCLIQELCQCNPAEDCSCCAECAACLGDLYRHCCDCVGMRKSSNHTNELPTLVSTVGTFDNSNPALFQALTQRKMTSLSCTIVRFPVIEELAAHRHGHMHSRSRHLRQQDKLQRDSERSEPENYWEDVQVVLRRAYDMDIADSDGLCTAVYFNVCFALKECVMSCEAMGSTSYRWFHNGCCECAGHTCLNYGNMYPKCSDCLQ